MMRASLFLLCLSACSAYRPLPSGPSTTGVLIVRCTRTAPYCGGAEPDPRDLPRPRPCTERMFLRPAIPDTSGRSALNDLRIAPIDTIRFIQGVSVIHPPAGDYLLLDEDRVDDHRYRQLLRDHRTPRSHSEAVDTACLRSWLHGPFGVISVRGGDTTEVSLDLHDQCPWFSVPCVPYSGPLPP